MSETAPTLTLHRRTPSEQRAWHAGARLALSMLLSRLPAVQVHPPIGTVAAADVLAELRAVEEMIRVSSEVVSATDPPGVQAAREEVAAVPADLMATARRCPLNRLHPENRRLVLLADALAHLDTLTALHAALGATEPRKS